MASISMPSSGDQQTPAICTETALFPKTVIPTVTLSSGQSMPVIGMGTAAFPAVGELTRAAVVDAMRVGYRHFDTSYLYQSEQPLGAAIKEALEMGIIKSRDELFITSKLSICCTERQLVLPSINGSLRNLELEYLDLYLVHSPLKLNPEARELPVAKEDISAIDLRAVWEEMEKCKNLGLTKAIGVSNFSPKRLEELLSFANIPPVLNQVEMSPLWHQNKLREYCEGKGIHVTAYSALGATGTVWGHNKIVESDVILQIAKAKGKTAAQIALRWVYEQGVSLVVKSFNKERMRQNVDVFDWSLTEEESAKIFQLPQHKAIVFANIFGPHDLVLELDAQL